MKGLFKNVKDLTGKELAESFVFRVQRTLAEMKSDSLAIQRLRNESSKNQEEDVAVTLHLLQQKYSIEDYAKKK